MAGYSKRTLVEKIGIKDVYHCLMINPPVDYKKMLGKLPKKTPITTYSSSEALAESRSISSRQARTIFFDFIQFFVTSQEALNEMFPILTKHLAKSGMLWISWPKGAYCTFVGSSDLNENIIRDIGLANRLVDVKVISVNENWSGLKFVYRLRDR